MIDLDRFRRCDRAYFEEIVRCHGWIVLKVVKGFSHDRDHADDLFQEVWVQVLENCRAFEGRGPFESWLHRVALNACRDEARTRTARQTKREKVAQEGVFWEGVWTPPCPLASVISEERLSFLRKAVAVAGLVAPREAQAIAQRYFHGKSYRLIAQVMEIEEATARSLVRKGIHRLRALLGDSEDDLS